MWDSVYKVSGYVPSSSSTAEGVFTKMKDVLSTHCITWVNCVGLSLDNTSVNVGCRNSIKTHLSQENPSTYVMGCPCHIIHNTAEKAGDAFEKVIRLDIEIVHTVIIQYTFAQ